MQSLGFISDLPVRARPELLDNRVAPVLKWRRKIDARPLHRLPAGTLALDFSPTSMYDGYSGSTKLNTHLDRNSHGKTIFLVQIGRIDRPAEYSS